MDVDAGPAGLGAEGSREVVALLRTFARLAAGTLLGVAVTVVGLVAVERQSARTLAGTREAGRLARAMEARVAAAERARAAYETSGDSAALAPALVSPGDVRAMLDSLRVLSTEGRRAARAPRPGRVAAVEDAVRGWTPGDAPAAARLELTLRRVVAAEDARHARRLQAVEALRWAAALALLGEALLIAGLYFGLRRRLLAQARVSDEQQARLAAQSSGLARQMSELAEATDEVARAWFAAEAEGRTREEAVALLDAALEGSPIGLGFLDRDLRFLRVNGVLAAAHGAGAAEHVGRSLGSVAPRLAAVAESAMRAVLERGEPVIDAEVSGALLDGNASRHWLASYYPMRDARDRVLGVGMVLAEVTDRRSLEDQLRQAQKMEAVGRLAGGVAHDFNNLLTVIRASGEMLLHDLPSGDARAEAAEIVAASERAAQLTRQLLAFSRKQVLQPARLDLNDVVRDLEPMLRRLIVQNVELVVAHGAPAPVTADRGQLEQVVVNLAINAADAMPAGGRLTVTTGVVHVSDGAHAEGSAPGRYATLTVSDTGVGMDDATLTRVFEPFFTTKPQGQGTGLGLSTVYGIVQQSRGHVWATSEPGRGSAFTVHLPLAEATEGTNATANTASTAAAAPLGSETVLVVEDEASVRSAVVRSLARRGYHVLEASDGAAALRLAAEHAGPIDLLLTDLMMPGIGGAELARRFGGLRPATRVLFMSGYADDESARAVSAQPEAAQLDKPFTLDELARRVREVLDGRRAAAADSRTSTR